MNNLLLVIHDGYGIHANPDDWCSIDSLESVQKFDNMNLREEGFVEFTNAVSPSVSTIMSIESIMSGLFAAKLHKLHWREWPSWDKVDVSTLSEILEREGYAVHGFSYLLNSENWMPCVRCYEPSLYKDFPSEKRDTHSFEAVISAFRHYFSSAFNPEKPQFLIVHSVHVYNFWKEMQFILESNGLTSDNTVIAFTSDHYFPKNFGRLQSFVQQNGGSLFHHTDVTEQNTRVPLYIRFPGSRHKQVNKLVSGYDLPPTLLSTLGIKYDDLKFDGVDILSSVGHISSNDCLCDVDYTNNALKYVRCDNVYPFQIAERQGRITSINNGVYKLIVKPDPPSSYVSYRMDRGWNIAVTPFELYDLRNDPLEDNNLYNESMSIKNLEIFKNLLNYYHKTSIDIYKFHSTQMASAAPQNSYGLLREKNIVVIQNTHSEICYLITQYLINLGANISLILLSDIDNYLFKSRDFKIKSLDSYLKSGDMNLLDSNAIDYIIFPVFSMGKWFGNVYNESKINCNTNIVNQVVKGISEDNILCIGVDSTITRLCDFNNTRIRKFEGLAIVKAKLYGLLRKLLIQIRNKNHNNSKYVTRIIDVMQ